jgi:Do/DeqQ family serine protease
VVDNATEITVTLQDGRDLTASVVGSDVSSDVAVLKVPTDTLVQITLGDSAKLEQGDFVVAIGNPFGLQHTVTSGIVSGLGRSGINPDGYEDFIQTDASINPGNSGGALVDFNGNLVGINSSIISPAGGNVGIGFAVPINMAMLVVDQLLEYGEIRRGLLGVRITDLTPDVVEALDLQVRSGAVVSSVEPGSPAEEAGVEAGDIIVAVNDDLIEGASDLRNTIGLTRAGTQISIGVIRNNKRQNLDVRIGDAPQVAESGVQAEASSVLEGADLGNIPSGHEAYGRVEGVLVTAVAQGSRAFRSGLEAGHIITAVNRRPVNSRKALLELLAQNSGTVALNVLRGNQPLFLIMR